MLLVSRDVASRGPGDCTGIVPIDRPARFWAEYGLGKPQPRRRARIPTSCGCERGLETNALVCGACGWHALAVGGHCFGGCGDLRPVPRVKGRHGMASEEIVVGSGNGHRTPIGVAFGGWGNQPQHDAPQPGRSAR